MLGIEESDMGAGSGKERARTPPPAAKTGGMDVLVLGGARLCAWACCGCGCRLTQMPTTKPLTLLTLSSWTWPELSISFAAPVTVTSLPLVLCTDRLTENVFT